MIGCPRYDTGFETLQERGDHVKSHSRRFKCPEKGCFYKVVGFSNIRGLNQHFSLCHTGPAPKFTFPRPRNPRPPAAHQQQSFRKAIESEDLDLIRDLIHTNGLLQDQVGQGEYTGLQYAARHGKLGSALLLLHCGSSVGAVNKHGTALNVACHWRQTDMVQFLLSNSRCEEDVNSKDSQGKTPLFSILRSGYGTKLPIVRHLLEDSRVFVNAKDAQGWTALSLVASWLVVGDSDVERVLKVLLEHDGIDVNARDNDGRTPLSRAASSGDWRGIKVLLQCGRAVDVNAKDAGGRTPLSWAAGSGSFKAVNAFLEHGVGVDVSAKDNEGRKPIAWVWGREEKAIENALLERGAIRGEP